MRGKENYFVRAVFEVPPGRGYVVGDIKIAGKPISYGAQITDFITIKLEGLATRIGASTIAPFTACRGACSVRGGAAGGRRRRARACRAGVAPWQLHRKPPRLPLAWAASAAEERAIVAKLPPVLRRELELDVTEAAAAPPALLPYPKLAQSLLKTRKVTGRILAYASPDSTYAVTKKLIASAQHSIVIGIYDFNADYMKDALKQAMRRRVTVSLMLDTNHDDDPGLFGELERLGATCVKAPSSSSGNPIAYFGNAHEKIIVVDGELVMIQSGNWSENSIPFNEGDGVVVDAFVPGNRDMGLAVHSPALAGFFADLVARDMRLAQGEPPDAAPEAIAALPPRRSRLRQPPTCSSRPRRQRCRRCSQAARLRRRRRCRSRR